MEPSPARARRPCRAPPRHRTGPCWRRRRTRPSGRQTRCTGPGARGRCCVTTVMDAISRRNDRSLSSASATKYSLVPSRALLPNAGTCAPMIAVGSRPACTSITAIIDDVVVLPWAPPTAIENRAPHDLGQHVGAQDHGDSAAPGLDDLGVLRAHGRRNHDHVDRSDVRRGRARRGTPARAPPAARSSPTAACPSPLTMYPSRRSTSAMAPTPLPPTPTQWIAFVRPSTGYPDAPAARAPGRHASARARSTMTRAASGFAEPARRSRPCARAVPRRARAPARPPRSASPSARAGRSLPPHRHVRARPAFFRW